MAYEVVTTLSEREALWWQAWRSRDYSWQGLAAKLGYGVGTLQDVWALESDRLIAEPGTDRLWTRWHCPFVFADGSLSPKASWSEADWRDLHQGLRARLAMGTAARPCRLDGIVIDRLDEGENAVPDEADFLWLRASDIFVRGRVDLRYAGLAMVDFHGAWFGKGIDLTGAKVLDGDMYNIVTPRPPVAERPVVKAVAPEPVVLVVAETEVESVPDTPPVEQNRAGLWVIVGLAAAAVAAGAVWLLHSL